MKAVENKGKKGRDKPSSRSRWSLVLCAARHVTVPMYVLPFINSYQQMFSQQVALLVEAITACRCLAQPSSQRLPLLELCWQSSLLQAKVIWISSHHLDQLLEQHRLTLHWGRLGSAHIILLVGSNQGPHMVQVTQQGLEEGVLP